MAKAKKSRRMLVRKGPTKAASPILDSSVNVRKDLSTATEALLRQILGTLVKPEDVLAAGAVAAEMLVHFGRGQLAAEKGDKYTAKDVGVVSPKTDIFKRLLPNDVELTEKMFMVFAKSVAASNKKGAYNIDSSVRRRVNGYAFLLGNLAWNNLNGAATLDLANLNTQLFALQQECGPALAGGGEFCHMGPF
jgi:hypothetical protein